MSFVAFLLAGIFLPIFPLSMLFNALYARMRSPVLRSLMLSVWPQIGLTIFFSAGVTVPAWVLAWSLLTSLLYATRALVLREAALWTSFIGTSAWALLWLPLQNDMSQPQLRLYALGVSVPLVLMALLNAGLERRFGAAYLGLYGGLAQSMPRFAGILAVVVLAIAATPVFPAFFAMLSMILKAIPAAPLLAVGVAAVWLLWSWAGARFLQGLLVGPVRMTAPDLSYTSLWLYIIVLSALMIAGVYWSELML